MCASDLLFVHAYSEVIANVATAYRREFYNFYILCILRYQQMVDKADRNPQKEQILSNKTLL